jgi:hypothetical protein
MSYDTNDTTISEQLLALRKTLAASSLSLQEDECGDWRINGSRGHIYAEGGIFTLCVRTSESRNLWTRIKRRLAFCRVTQDGDDEGCLVLDRLPTPAEADLICQALGIERHINAVAADA